MCVGFTTAATIVVIVVVVVVVVVVVLAATVDSEASNAVLPPLHPVDRNRTKYSLSRPAGQRAACLARIYLYDLAGPYIGASAKQTRSGIRARVRRQSASRRVCERRKIARVYSAKTRRAVVCVGTRGKRASPCRSREEDIAGGVAAVSQSNDNDRRGRQPVATAKNTTDYAERRRGVS